MKVIPNEMLRTTCKMGQGGYCCRYIIAGPGGICCAKHSDLKEQIDSKVKQKHFVARGDNCPGL